MAPRDVLGPTVGDLMTLQPLIGVMELLYDDDDLEWSLTCHETDDHVLGMMKKPMKTWNP